MEKIDRLGWAAGISFVSYGVRVGVRVNRRDALDLLKERFPPKWSPSTSPVVERLYSLIIGGEGRRLGVRRMNLLYSDAARIARTLDLDAAMDQFESDLQLHVAEMARGRIFVHAGVVGWQRRAIVIPGRSFAGKTSLVTELVRAGATYYSDEYAVVDRHGRVHPYPKPPATRTADNGTQVKTPIVALGGKVGVEPLPIGLVVVSHYKDGARWRPRRLSRGQGVLWMLANTVPARRRPEATLATLERAMTDARVLKAARGEAQDVARRILDSVGDNMCFPRRRQPTLGQHAWPRLTELSPSVN
jgi:hypothetical protein